MATASNANDWEANPPKLPPLKPGQEFDIYLGERRITWPGVRDYFQKDNRRYLCEVIATRGGGLYRSKRRGLIRKQIPTVKVLSTV